ncbi:MAG: hypothetical protein ACYTGJ_01620 [Planctomycetota bacterium]|jgi:hypothetical protein
MIGEPKTIARIVELVHLPVNHDPEVLRQIYSMVSVACGYDNFIKQADGARLETAPPAGSGGSRVIFLRDRIVFQEERTDATLEHFARKVEAVLKAALPKLGIPMIIGRTITQRLLLGVPGGESAADFLSRKAFRIEADDLEGFERAGQVVGLRLDFPMRQPQEAGHRIRIESFLREPGSLFLEDVATWKIPVQGANAMQITEELEQVDEFVGDRVIRFLGGLGRSG